MPTLGEDLEETSPVYLYIPVNRYIFMCIVTFGLYEVYWIYKNWEYLKNRDNLDIHPLWRGIFGIFFCHSLLEKIFTDELLNKYEKPTFNHSGLAWGWVITVILSYFLSRLSGINDIFLIIGIVLIFVELLFFIPVQKYINNVNEQKNPEVEYYPWSLGHFILIGIAIFIVIIGFLSA